MPRKPIKYVCHVHDIFLSEISQTNNKLIVCNLLAKLQKQKTLANQIFVISNAADITLQYVFFNIYEIFVSILSFVSKRKRKFCSA